MIMVKYAPVEPLSDSFQHQIDYTKLSNKWVLPRRYYTFKKKYGSKTIEFFVLDTNIDVMDQQTINKQIKFMKKIKNLMLIGKYYMVIIHIVQQQVTEMLNLNLKNFLINFLI